MFFAKAFIIFSSIDVTSSFIYGDSMVIYSPIGFERASLPTLDNTFTENLYRTFYDEPIKIYSGKEELLGGLIGIISILLFYLYHKYDRKNLRNNRRNFFCSRFF